MRTLHALLLSALFVTSAGCSLSLEMRSSGWLNPRPRSDGSVAQKTPALMEFLVLQLTRIEPEQRRTLVNQTSDAWGQFADRWREFRSKGTFPDFLKPLLAFPATLPESERPREHFTIEPLHLIETSLRRRLSTEHLLIITLGAERAEGSVRLVNVGWSDGTLPLCFHEYEAFVPDSSGRWPCNSQPMER